MLENFLQQLGLSDKETTVYLSMLGLGENAVSTISQKSKLTRTTVYSILETLNRKGFINQIEKNRIKYYQAKRPELILAMLDQRLRETNLQKIHFQKLLPQFQALINRSTTQPKVRYFEGLEGIKQIYEDTLKEGKDKLAYSCAPDVKNPELIAYLKNYTIRRAAKGLHARAIFPDTEAARTYAAQAKKYLLTTTLVPADKYPFKSEITIYSNKIAYISLIDSLHGVIIESEEIATTEKSIFELAWIGSGTK